MAETNPQAIIAWVQLAHRLTLLGIDAAAGIKRAVKAMQPDVSNDELNAIVHAVIDDAERRKVLAQADAAGLGPQPGVAGAGTGTAGKLSPTGQPGAFTSASPLASPPPGVGPTGTDGITGTHTANTAPPAPGGKDGAHSHVDRPSGGLPGTASALPEGNSPFAAEAETGKATATADKK